jgi:uncharacterized membrane protein
MGSVFKDKGEFSWRKIMTCGALICFMMSVIGYLFNNKFAELPGSYQAIIAGVFVFYFGKELVRKTKIFTEEEK